MQYELEQTGIPCNWTNPTRRQLESPKPSRNMHWGRIGVYEHKIQYLGFGVHGLYTPPPHGLNTPLRVRGVNISVE